MAINFLHNKIYIVVNNRNDLHLQNGYKLKGSHINKILNVFFTR